MCQAVSVPREEAAALVKEQRWRDGRRRVTGADAGRGRATPPLKEGDGR